MLPSNSALADSISFTEACEAHLKHSPSRLIRSMLCSPRPPTLILVLELERLELAQSCTSQTFLPISLRTPAKTSQADPRGGSTCLFRYSSRVLPGTTSSHSTAFRTLPLTLRSYIARLRSMTINLRARDVTLLNDYEPTNYTPQESTSRVASSWDCAAKRHPRNTSPFILPR